MFEVSVLQVMARYDNEMACLVVPGLPLLITPPSGDDIDSKRCPVRLPEEDMSRLVT